MAKYDVPDEEADSQDEAELLSKLDRTGPGGRKRKAGDDSMMEGQTRGASRPRTGPAQGTSSGKAGSSSSESSGIIIPEDGWVQAQHLGSGSFGQVSLWVRFDKEGNIIDRLAAKDTDIAPERQVPNVTFYIEGGTAYPREAYMHSLAASRDLEGQHIVMFRGDHLMAETNVHRLLLEFCPYGDMFDVKDRMRSRIVLRPRQIATPMLWALFEALAKAEHLMAFGAYPDEMRTHGWTRMIHRDLKPENILLAEPSQMRWRGVPKFKVGDFGLAALEHEEHLQFDAAGTTMFFSPEMTHIRHLPLPTGLEISTPTDVWSIGATMAELMNLKSLGTGEPFDFYKEDSELPRIDAAGQNFYPPALVEIVHACLERNPDDRITLEDLCEWIDLEITELCKAELSEDDRNRFPLANEVPGKICRLEL